MMVEALARMLVSALAEAGRGVRIEIRDNCVSVESAAKADGRASAETRGAKTYEARNAKTGEVERHTLKEWCEIVGDGSSPHALYQRIASTGVAGPAPRRPKSDRTEAKRKKLLT